MEKINKSLKTDEYEGTLTVNRAITIDCNNSTFWAYNKSVIKVNSPGVVLKNARIELLSGNGYAIETTSPDLILENVEVRGNIKGLPDEPELWKIPSLIPLGEFAPECENIFYININVPTECRIESNLYGVEILPLNLKRGTNSIKITVAPMRNNTILYGEIFIKSKVKRRICISGKAVENAPHISQSPEIVPDIPVLKKGQRIVVDERFENDMKFVFKRKSVRKNMDIDGYVFLLGENGKAFRDEDLIFFSNPTSDDSSVKLTGDSNSPEITVNLSGISEKYSKVAICFAIYGDDNNLNFSLVDSPFISIFANQKEILRFPLENLLIEKTVVAVELYRYNNRWKINCIGSGYKDGLRRLCESYGIEVDS